MISVNGNPFIFDTFIKNDILYLISTHYNNADLPITIKVNGVQADEEGYNEYEPVRCFFTKAPSNPNVKLEICGNEIPVSVRIVESNQPSGIGIATLFKSDAYRIPDFINYYKKQGVTKFWFYYNGSKLPPGLPEGENINYRLWDYTYFNTRTNTCHLMHCAQTAFLTLCSKLYLPDVEWLILNDLDEWIYHENTTIADYLKNILEDKQIVQIRNHWAKRRGNEIKYSSRYSNDFNIRSKCIYRNTYKDYFGIHFPKTKNLNLIERDVNLKMLHIRDEGGVASSSHHGPEHDNLVPPISTLILKDYILTPVSN